MGQGIRRNQLDGAPPAPPSPTAAPAATPSAPAQSVASPAFRVDWVQRPPSPGMPGGPPLWTVPGAIGPVQPYRDPPGVVELDRHAASYAARIGKIMGVTPEAVLSAAPPALPATADPQVVDATKQEQLFDATKDYLLDTPIGLLSPDAARWVKEELRNRNIVVPDLEKKSLQDLGQDQVAGLIARKHFNTPAAAAALAAGGLAATIGAAAQVLGKNGGSTGPIVVRLGDYRFRLKISSRPETKVTWEAQLDASRDVKLDPNRTVRIGCGVSASNGARPSFDRADANVAYEIRLPEGKRVEISARGVVGQGAGFSVGISGTPRRGLNVGAGAGWDAQNQRGIVSGTLSIDFDESLKR